MKRIIKSSRENQRFLVDPLFSLAKIILALFVDPSGPKQPTEKINLQEQDPGKTILSEFNPAQRLWRIYNDNPRKNIDCFWFDTPRSLDKFSF